MNGFFKKSATKSSKTRSLRDLQDAQKNAAFAAPPAKASKPKPSDLRGLPAGKFRGDLRTFLLDQDDHACQQWVGVFEHANKGRAVTRPDEKWLTEGEALIAIIGKAVFARICQDWMQSQTLEPAVPDASLDVLRALLHLCALVPSDALALSFGQLATRAFRKVGGRGPRSQKIGNACIWALEKMALDGSDAGVAELVGIRDRTIYDSVRKATNTALTAIAARRMIRQTELEEHCLPTFGFGANGTLIKEFADYTATITLDTKQASIVWTDPCGKPRKSVPAALKKSHHVETAELVQLTKNLKAVLYNQAAQLEETFLKDSSWPLAEWVQRFLEHPMRRPLTTALIWVAREAKSQTAFMLRGRDFYGVDGRKINAFDDEAVIRLWHPIDAIEADLVSWQGRFVMIEQPFAQTDRQIYTLTNAERDTATYSNRFAAHILKHHQFAMLCKKRGWRYKEYGLRDVEPSFAKKHVASVDVCAEFQIAPIFDPKEAHAAGDPSQAKTGQVRFSSPDETVIPLINIPAIAFSELMRDIDMFMSVTSVADDDGWSDPNLR
ncbi:MAG: DUF4132 domain-containing protein [Litoreibacter sp.]